MTPEPTSIHTRHASKLGRNAFANTWTAAIGMVTGAAVDVIVIAIFGLGWQTDAYFIAFTIPMLLTTLMRIQATRVVQALFMKKYEQDGPEQGWYYFNLISANGFVMFGAIFVMGACLSGLIVRAQALGAPANEISLATSLSFWMFLMMPLYIPITTMKVAMQSFGMFGLPGAAKFFENISKIIFLTAVGRFIGVRALVLGSFVGALAQLLIYYNALRKKGYRFRLVVDLKHPDFVQVCKLMVFPTAAQGVSMGVEALNNTICSVLGSGNVTALRLANRIVDSLAGLLPASIVLAAMPSVSASFIRNDVDGAKKHLQHGLYLLALVTAPVSVWLIMLNQPFIALMYQRRSFTAADTTLVATLLMFMVPYMFLGRFWGLLELPFFAQQKTWTPFVGAVIMAVVFAGASLPLVGVLGIYAVPTGRCISYIVCVAFLSFLLHRQIGRIGFGAVTKQLIKVCLAAVFMGICLYAGRIPVRGIHPAGIIRKSIILGVPTCLGFAGYLVALVMLGLKDFNRIIAKKAPFAARWLDYAALWRSRMRAAISNS